MELDKIREGLRVRVIADNGTMGMFVKKEHLALRRVGATGTILYYVPGHGGDVWWVKHDACDDIAAYSFTELEETSLVTLVAEALSGGQ